jgi:ribosomal protein S18 acetylase RimI-like enzyme
LNEATQLPTQLTDKLGNPFSVRVFNAATDRDLLEQMYASFQPKRAAQGLPPETEYALRRWLDHVLKSGLHLLVEIDGGVCGHVMLIPMPEADTTELAIFLHQSIRGRGIGTAMNRLAVALAREAGFKRVWLSVEPSNIPAIRSYQKAGFLTLRYSMWAPEIEMEVRF